MESTEYNRHVNSGSQNRLVTNTGNEMSNIEFIVPCNVNEKLVDKFKWFTYPLVAYSLLKPSNKTIK